MDDMRLAEKAVNAAETKIAARNVQVYYGDSHAIKDVDIDIADRTVTAFIGPSGCGKSTFLRCLNRMNDTIRGTHAAGQVFFDGKDIYAPAVDVVELRQHIGMVFQRPNPSGLAISTHSKG